MLCKNIIVRNENNVSIINLNRPKSLNALNAETVAELDKVFDELAADKNTGAVVITGEKNFAAGADITNMAELSPEEARAFSFSKTFNKIANCPKPVIAAIEGFASAAAWNWRCAAISGSRRRTRRWVSRRSISAYSRGRAARNGFRGWSGFPRRSN